MSARCALMEDTKVNERKIENGIIIRDERFTVEQHRFIWGAVVHVFSTPRGGEFVGCSCVSRTIFVTAGVIFVNLLLSILRFKLNIYT